MQRYKTKTDPQKQRKEFSSVWGTGKKPMDQIETKDQGILRTCQVLIAMGLETKVISYS